MTVQELINELLKYPKDKKVYTDWGLANYIGENFSGDILLKHRDTDEEKRKKYEEDADIPQGMIDEMAEMYYEMQAEIARGK